jgi:hypothetical protein
VGVGVVVGVGFGPGQTFPTQMSDDTVIINPTSPYGDLPQTNNVVDE